MKAAAMSAANAPPVVSRASVASTTSAAAAIATPAARMATTGTRDRSADARAERATAGHRGRRHAEADECQAPGRIEGRAGRRDVGVGGCAQDAQVIDGPE